MFKQLLTLILTFVMIAAAVPSQLFAQVSNSARPVIEDGTPLRLRLTKTISSADASVDDRVDFEVLEDVKVGEVTVIKQGSIAWATVTEAQPKRRMGKGGKLNVNIDGVKTIDGQKVPLRGVKQVQGGGHTGAMTGAMVGTAIVFWPAAPFFLFMKGKDITVPKGHEVTVYVNGDQQIDMARLMQNQMGQSASAAGMGGMSGTVLAVASMPAGADIEVDGAYVGSTPSSINIASGDHHVVIKKSGYRPWQRRIRASGGSVNVQAELQRK